MTERATLLITIASTIADYRERDLDPPTADHVNKWISQFHDEVQVPLMRELAHMLGKTYLSKSAVTRFFRGLIRKDTLAGKDPCAFWRRARILDIQQNGHSQSEIRALFADALIEECDIDSVNDCGTDGGAYLYLDDVLFTGGRIGDDLGAWLKADAPNKGDVHIVVIAAHRFGEWKCSERLKEEAKAAKKKIEFHFWAALRLENRRAHKNTSEVLWPAVLPGDKELKAYMAEETKFPFEPRQAGGKCEHAIFSSEEGRQLLEREFLMAGMRIRSFSQNPKRILRPLGFSPFGLGFGSTIVTYRNCPNNAPLALWWGDPNAAKSHPFSKWYPLVPRKTYASEDPFDGVF